jgi:hypothetical protein
MPQNQDVRRRLSANWEAKFDQYSHTRRRVGADCHRCENFATALVPIAIALLASARDFVPTATVSLAEIASPVLRLIATLE